MKHFILALSCAWLSTTTLSLADTQHNSDNPTSLTRPDAHAPIGVMGDHMHKAGEFMFALRQMHMSMNNNKIGTHKQSDEQILMIDNGHAGMPKLRAVPQHMDMDMTMISGMYAPNNRVTLMLGSVYTSKEMAVRTYNGMGTYLGQFTSRSQGLGDTTLAALIALPNYAGGELHAGLGLSLPTGSIKQQGMLLTPMNTIIQARLPYGMQLGSGTYDLIPSLTYNKRWARYSFGAQIGATLRLDDNRQGYALGDEAYLKAWGARRLNDSLSLSLSLSAISAQDIHGQDALIDKPVQTAQPAFYGGERVNLGIGVNWLGTQGVLLGHRLALEISGPAYEDLNGPQMAQDWNLMLGYQKAF